VWSSAASPGVLYERNTVPSSIVELMTAVPILLITLALAVYIVVSFRALARRKPKPVVGRAAPVVQRVLPLPLSPRAHEDEKTDSILGMYVEPEPTGPVDPVAAEQEYARSQYT
jgi:hypothetical protein